MSKKLLILMALLSTLIMAFAGATALAADVTDNKCFNEWDCGDGTTDESKYWWEAGWCAAAIEAGIVDGTVENCTSTPDDDYIEPVVEEEEKVKKKKKKATITFALCLYTPGWDTHDAGTDAHISYDASDNGYPYCRKIGIPFPVNNS